MPMSTIPANPFAFVAGSAHLDIIATVTGQADVLDKIGDVRYEFGGTAYNYAVNLRAQGIPVTFMGALNRSPISQMLLTEMRSNGVRSHVLIDDSLPEAGFSAHLVAGDLISAVSSMPVEAMTFSDDFIRRGMRDARCVVADCNLAVETLEALARHARDRGIPLFIAGVSEPKVLRVKAMTGGLISALLINEAEADTLIHKLWMDDWPALGPHFGAHVVITRGSKGVALITPEGTREDFAVTAQQLPVGANVLGAGDLLGASLIAASVFGEQDLPTAIRHGIATAVQALQRGNANLGKAKALHSNIEAIASQAERDKLTGLLNRHGLERFMLTNSLHERPFYVILCDVDHFKKLNDTYGHGAGDEVLAQVGQAVAAAVRQRDAVGRWGGEEFVCLIDDTVPEVASSIAERIRSNVSKIQIPDIATPITISAGVAAAAAGEDWKQALEEADKALYLAKKAGRNRVELALS